ncbi:hypothetical protein SAMN05216404_11016 [Nitrosospira multiformis]|uniref:Uncharacterized protein n=1 Tax=Nitrosospira multiformis TaxID=1231 RepID=A0A1H8L8B0_9PROT|nr:hypothetical protein [Nitrosospira multiformis]SEO01341.1 hypothetical protein SAMN05216404_11016 [Nitrosospira multiformis]
MKKHLDQVLFGNAFASFDHRSAAFRQKMFEHFQTNKRRQWKKVEGLPEAGKNHGVIYFRESV